MSKRTASKMSASERACVFEILASNYTKALATAQRDADDEEQFGTFGTIDKTACLAESAVIDPELLPPAKKSKFVKAFGSKCGKFELDTTDMTADKHTEYPVAGKPGVQGVQFREYKGVETVKTFIEQGSYELEDPNGDEMVVIRIKTGKGGRQQFRVPKRVAKDMVGCD